MADTKFEFAYELNELGKPTIRIMLVDEVLTPDSSRFWPADKYEAGRDQESFDKQFVRNYLESINFDKSGPGVELPDDIRAKTTSKYYIAYKMLTGSELGRKTFEMLNLLRMDGTSLISHSMGTTRNPYSLSDSTVFDDDKVPKTFFITDSEGNIESIPGVSVSMGFKRCAAPSDGQTDAREVHDGALVEVVSGNGFSFTAIKLGTTKIGPGHEEDFVLFEVQPEGAFLAASWATTAIMKVIEQQ